jgi:hypothetical protein
MKTKSLIAVVLMALLALATPAQAQKRTVVGPEKQRLTAEVTTNLRDGQLVKVVGTAYNKKVGIYLAFCELPKKNQLPTNCAGGVNLEGESQSSYWISDNAPKYAGDLVKRFTPRGGFILNLKVSRYIGTTDCALKKCAILTRADHTRASYRLADVVIPVSFRK